MLVVAIAVLLARQHLTVDQRLSGRLKGVREGIGVRFVSGFAWTDAGRLTGFVAGRRVAAAGLFRFSLHRQRPRVGRLSVAGHHVRRARRSVVSWMVRAIRALAKMDEGAQEADHWRLCESFGQQVFEWKIPVG